MKPMSMLGPLSALLAVSLCACTSFQYTARDVPAPLSQPPGARSVVIVRVPMPWYAPRAIVRGKFRDVLDEYEAITALEAKYFTISDDSRFGGIYLWKTRPDAEKHFDGAWRENVRRRRGVEAEVMVMDAPFVVEGKAQPLGKTMGARSQEYPAVASLVRFNLPENASTLDAAKTLSTGVWSTDALIRGFVVSGDRFVGVVALWATRNAAENAVRAAAIQPMQTAVGAESSQHVLFEAPLLLDDSLRRSIATK